MVQRLPESWIPPDHILDLRARVRLRHELGEQRAEWQQRIQATLYHHGCPQRRQLMVADGRDWLQAQPLPETAREQVTLALEMIDALDLQMRPIEKELRAFARRQAGCKALMVHLRDRGADRGDDPRRARWQHPILILAPGCPVRRAGPAPGRLLPPRPRGRPRKTELPQRLHQRDHPIKHHVAGPGAAPRVVDRSKAGRPRAQHRHRQPRRRIPGPQQLYPRQPRTLRLTRDPCTSKKFRLLADRPSRQRENGLGAKRPCGASEADPGAD